MISPSTVYLSLASKCTHSHSLTLTHTRTTHTQSTRTLNQLPAILSWEQSHAPFRWHPINFWCLSSIITANGCYLNWVPLSCGGRKAETTATGLDESSRRHPSESHFIKLLSSSTDFDFFVFKCISWYSFLVTVFDFCFNFRSFSFVILVHYFLCIG